MKQITFSKVAIFVCLLCAILLLATSLFAQDSIITARKVKIAENRAVYLKTGKTKARPHWEKVQSGYFIKQTDNDYIINGKLYHPGDNKPLKIKK